MSDVGFFCFFFVTRLAAVLRDVYKYACLEPLFNCTSNTHARERTACMLHVTELATVASWRKKYDLACIASKRCMSALLLAVYGHLGNENDGDELQSSRLLRDLSTFDSSSASVCVSPEARRKAKNACWRPDIRKRHPVILNFVGDRVKRTGTNSAKSDRPAVLFVAFVGVWNRKGVHDQPALSARIHLLKPCFSLIYFLQCASLQK